ncbi:MAG: nucleotidyltransferase [Rhodocyclales bacterium GWA2_65_19]|nr:MAG: nucleotidyltransferase [Rhodocyclales bacterium GWA2_65_19]
MASDSREELLAFLRRHAPFKDMGALALAELAACLTPVAAAGGSSLLGPNDVPPDLFIVQSGKVQARLAGDVKLTDQPLYELESGQCFPVAAVAAKRLAINTYTAVGNVHAWRLASADFFTMLLSSPEFNRFVLDHVAGLLDESRRQIELQFGQGNAEQQSLNAQLSTLPRQAVIRVTPQASIRAAMDTMVRAKVGSVVVADTDDRPLGIFTQSDALRRVMFPDYPTSAAIEEVMTTPPATIPAHATMYEAMLAMATHGIRHLVVVDADERVAGVVSERDLFAVQRVGLRNIRKLIEAAADIDALSQAAGDVRRLCLNMMGQGVSAEKLTQFISGLNDSLTRRVIEITLTQHDLFGLDWAWLAFGSEGRDEQTFSTDQDNGIIFVCPDFADRDELKLRFLDFAREVNEGLARCGFPLCKGNIMASNPLWCLTQDEWQERFMQWVRGPEPEALLNATIFFDFRPLYGNEALAKALRKWLLDLTANAKLFLRFMAENALKSTPPLGMIRDFVYDNNPDFPHTLDLKAFGARPFVDAARIIALAHGIPHSSTTARLRAAAAQMKLGNDDVNAVIDGFFFIQTLRLRNQRGDTQPGAANRVDPDKLNELDRQVLKEAFKQAKRLQSRLQLEYRL